MAVKKPIAVAVLNTVQALAADADLTGNKFTITGLGREISLSQIDVVDYDVYAAGTASIKDIDFTGVTLLANYQYRVAVRVPGKVAFHGGGQEANQLIPIREYVVSTGSVAPTATQLAALFVARINADLGADVSAASVAGDIMRLTLTNSLYQGDFTLEYPDGATTAVNTAFVAPAGTPAMVELLAPGLATSASYNTYTISFRDKRRHNAVTGGLVEFPEDVKIFLNSADGDTAALVVEINAIFAGTHTPATDYDGI